MAIKGKKYFQELKDYLNVEDYKQCNGDNGQIVLREKVHNQDGSSSNKKIIFKYSGDAIAIKLDKNTNPLFHFLCNNGREWSKRCDFIIFNRKNNSINVYCIECKSYNASSINEARYQLKSGENFCKILNGIIQEYTGSHKTYNLKKFVFSTNPNPTSILTNDGLYLKDDDSIRHYYYGVLQGQDSDLFDLNELTNTNVIKVK